MAEDEFGVGRPALWEELGRAGEVAFVCRVVSVWMTSLPCGAGGDCSDER